ncbi:BlaI/MecI/CopY family transcriptional regulator [Anaerosporobacter faecicola]|uniref:BlaI/MecI/CopY family transcriptional regulator n=1 Tax=Anaerosporobacter faecicola TaxID=2718714 RepID=UPI00143C386F|nr:BlaI/MecI/CopY family transcriptional regulator [Anaerosporobacter faecicola]
MENYKLYDGEYRFVNLVWENEPVGSGELVKLCNEAFGWKKSTTYTVLKKLCDRGILQNENAIVTALVNKKQIQRYESEAILNKAFDGSLPQFLAAFLGNKKLSKKEANELKELIDAHRRE